MGPLPISLIDSRDKGVSHQLKAGSSLNSWATAYSAISTGFDSLSVDKGTHDVVPSFHSTQSFQPFVVFFGYFLPRIQTKASSLGTAFSSFL
jgi:hypothetical protein